MSFTKGQSVKGFFNPTNKEKYVGDVRNICYRSGFEFKYMRFLDSCKDVVSWNSEEKIVKYLHPIDGRVRRYFPDFWVKYKDGHEELIEVKPYYQTIAPNPPKKKTKKGDKRFLKEQIEFAINTAKWTYARGWCEPKGIEFKLITEKELKNL